MTGVPSTSPASTDNASHILITGAAGFIGQELAAAFLSSSPFVQLTLTDLVEPSLPAAFYADTSRVTTVKANLTNPDAVNALLKTQYSAIYLLHGLMSGGAESDLELGYRVNFDSHRHILDVLCVLYPGTLVVFPSSIAVFGPTKRREVVSEYTCPVPQSSYGTQKLMIELLVNDYSRRGLLDGRVVRLPTVIVRPGMPSAAASSFASGIVRESFKGERNFLPVGQDLEMWVCSPRTVVQNLVYVMEIAKERFGISPTVNLPGKCVTVGQILEALEEVGGREKRSLVEERRDLRIEKIVASWPARFDTSKARELGMVEDQELIETVRDFADGFVA